VSQLHAWTILSDMGVIKNNVAEQYLELWTPEQLLWAFRR